MEHVLKIGDERLKNLVSGIKKVEVRLNDRDYQRHDILIFKDRNDVYAFQITHIHSGLGMQENYVALSVTKFGEDGNGK